MTDELISRTTRGLFRSLMTGSTVGEIAAAFQDEGFAPNPDCTYQDSSVRRETTQTYLEAADWQDPRYVARALRVFGRLMHGFDAQYTEQLRHSLRRDGYVIDPETGHITSAGPQFAASSLDGLKDASAITPNDAEYVRWGGESVVWFGAPSRQLGADRMAALRVWQQPGQRADTAWRRLARVSSSVTKRQRPVWQAWCPTGPSSVHCSRMLVFALVCC